MRKFWKILMIVLDVIVIGAIIFVLLYLAKWAGSQNMLDVNDVFQTVR